MLPRQIAQEVEKALRGLQYGSVQLVVHDAKVVRIERVERIRLPAATGAAQAGLTDPSEALPTGSGKPTPSLEDCLHAHQEG